MQRKLSEAWSPRSSFGALKSPEAEFGLDTSNCRGVRFVRFESGSEFSCESELPSFGARSSPSLGFICFRAQLRLEPGPRKMLSECPQTQGRVTEFRFAIESEFRFHLFSHTAPEWSPDPEKCFPNVLRHPPKMPPEGLWKPLQGTARRRPGKGPKKTTLCN